MLPLVPSMFPARSQSEFNPYRCGYCEGTEKLKLCSSCKLISFCSASCQKEYWPRHRPLCRSIGKSIKVQAINSIFEGHLGGGQGLRRAIICLLNNVSFAFQTQYRRDLDFEEHLLIAYPRYCEHCFNTNPYTLQSCPDCNFAAFCKTRDCQKRSKSNPNGHHKYCDQKRIAFLCQREMDYEKVFTELPSPARFEDFLQDNQGLFYLIEHLSKKKFIHNPTTREEMMSYSTVSQFNFTATLLHALFRANLLHPDRESLYIDIVGVQYEVDFFGAETCSLFYAFMPKLHSLEINLVGPELSVPMNGKNPRVYTKNVDCFGKTTKITHYKMGYEQPLVQLQRIPKPDFIMYFNCSFGEKPWVFKEPSWVEIFKMRVPFAITDCTNSKLADDIKFLKKFMDEKDLQSEVTGVFMGDNPFKDLRCYHTFDRLVSDEPLLNGNSKLCVMNWKNIIGEEEFERCKTLFDHQYQ